MNKEVQLFLRLLSHELFGNPLADMPSAADWGKVLALGRKHAVSALLYWAAKDCSDTPQWVTDELHQTAMLALTNNEKLMHTQDRVISVLSAKGIPSAILKGASAACCYPHSELRIMGDIDVLVGEQFYDAACSALIEDGFAYTDATEMHGNFEGFGAAVEVHRFVSSFPDTDKGRYAKEYMSDAMLRTRKCTINESSFPVLNPPEQLVSMLAHLERHMGTTGIGLRQVCDWAVAVHANRSAIDLQALQLLEDCGLLHFAKIITRLCEKYLGLPPFEWSTRAADNLVDAVLYELLDAGNFTLQSGERVIEVSMINARESYGGDRKSLFQSYTSYVRYKTQLDFPQIRSSLWQPLFWVYYPVQWLFRVVTGKRRAANPLSALRQAHTRADLLGQLALYR